MEEKINIKDASYQFHTDLIPSKVLNNTFAPYILNTPTTYSIHQIPKILQHAETMTIWNNQNRIKNITKCLPNINWKLTFKYLNFQNKPLSRNTDPKKSILKTFKVIILTSELPTHLTLYNRNPKSYPNPHCAKCPNIPEDILHMLICPHNQVELKEIIKEAITKNCEDNEIESSIASDLAQEMQDIHIKQKIPIGIISNNLSNLGPLKKKPNLLPNIYHRIAKKIHKYIWKPSRQHLQCRSLLSLTPSKNINATPTTSIDRQYTIWLHRFIQFNQTSPLTEPID
jgi:hypothetical protein